MLLAVGTGVLASFALPSAAQAADGAAASFATATLTGMDGTSTTITDGESYLLNVEWSLPDNPATPAVMDVTMPAGLSLASDSGFPLKKDDGQIGTCTITGTTDTSPAVLHCDFDTAYLTENPLNLHGGLTLSGRLDLNNSEQQTLDFPFGNTVTNTITVNPKATEAECTDDACQPQPQTISKFGTIERGDAQGSTSWWTVYVPAPATGLAGGTEITLDDVPATGLGDIDPSSVRILELPFYKIDANGNAVLERDSYRQLNGGETGLNLTKVENPDGTFTISFTARDSATIKAEHADRKTDARYYYNGDDAPQAMYIVQYRLRIDEEAMAPEAGTMYTNTVTITTKTPGDTDTETATGYATSHLAGAWGVGTNQGGFSVVKKVEGSAASGIDTASPYTISYTLQDPPEGQDAEGTFTVSGDGEPGNSPLFEAGQTVTINEVKPVDTAAVTWGTPTLTDAEGNPLTLPYTVTFDGTGLGQLGTRLSLGLTNTATLNTTSFSVQKSVVDPDALGDDLPSTYTIHYDYTYDKDAAGFSSQKSGDLTVSADGTPVTVDDVPVGAQVTLSEVTPTTPADVSWDAPVFSQQSFTAAANTVTAVTVTNTAHKVLPAKVSVGDYVWYDTNADGVQDAGEPGIEGVTLTLTGPDGKPVTDVDGNPVDPVQTDADGKYSFDDLPVLADGQSYTVTVTDPEGLTPTKAGVGDRATDSSTGSASSEGLTENGQRDPTLDFGYVGSVSVGDYVWYDTDADGIQDKGEPGIEGVTLTLTGPDGQPVTDVHGNPVNPVQTDADGKYSFDDLPVLADGQSYTVTVTDPEGYAPTKAGVGDRATDSSTGSASSEGLTENGQRDPTLDFGYVGSVSVGDYVWYDTDADGVQDAGEPGIEGVTLTLTGPDGKSVTDVHGNPVNPVQTDADGKYSFDGLPVLQDGESYTVHVTNPEGFTPTKAGVGDRATDSSTGSAASQGLTEPGQRDPSLDFGYVGSVSVGDYVWYDTNADGVQDAGEPGIEGVTLTLTGPDGKPVTDVHGNPVSPVQTDADGKYSFDGLPVLQDGQSYTVTVTNPAGHAPTKAGVGDRATDSSTGSASSEGLTENGQRDSTLDFGYVGVVSVGDYVWVDTDHDGVQDDGEPGIEGVELTLTGPDGQPVVDVYGNPVNPVKTDKDGKYSFGDLPVLADGQSYTVTVKAPEGYTPTTAGVGDRAKDSSTGSASSQGLTRSGESDLTLDFGFVLSTAPVAASPSPSPTPSATPVVSAPSGLATTGGQLPVIAIGVAALLLLGGALLMGRRRRLAVTRDVTDTDEV